MVIRPDVWDDYFCPTAQGNDGIKTGKGFYDYTVDFSEEDLDKAVQQRDQEFLNRLKNLYLEK